MTDTTAAGGQTGSMQLTGKVLLYENPEPLSLERHRGLGVKRMDRPFEFLRTATVAPLTVNEFGVACGSFPIIFAGDEKVPLAVMGIRKDENLFVTPDGQFERNLYVPAYVRRYPFIFANDESNDKLVLCIDRGAATISDQPDIAFFEDDKPSKYTNDAIEFCKEFERQRRGTVEFTKICGEHDLFEQKTVTFQPRNADGSEGQPQKIADYMSISEQKLNQMDPATLAKLRDQGVLQACYAHLISLLNWQRVIQSALGRMQAEQQAGRA